MTTATLGTLWFGDFGGHNTKMKRMKATEIRLLIRLLPGYSLQDRMRNEDIITELGMACINKAIREYKEEWLQHVTRMQEYRFPNIMQRYRPQRCRKIGNPVKR